MTENKISPWSYISAKTDLITFRGSIKNITDIENLNRKCMYIAPYLYSLMEFLLCQWELDDLMFRLITFQYISLCKKLCRPTIDFFLCPDEDESCSNIFKIIGLKKLDVSLISDFNHASVVKIISTRIQYIMRFSREN